MGVALGIFDAIVGTLIAFVGIGLLIQAIQFYDNAITIFQQQTRLFNWQYYQSLYLL
jgi:hypothetical protein